jgi:hypothetical protein
MFLTMYLRKFYLSMMMLESYTLWYTFSRSTILLNVTMRSMIRNSWLLFMSLKNDNLKLEKAVFSIDVITNHKNLEYFITIKKLNHHQAHWSEYLFHFDFKIVYCSEKTSEKSDALIYQSKIFLRREIALMNIICIKIRQFWKDTILMTRLFKIFKIILLLLKH